MWVTICSGMDPLGAKHISPRAAELQVMTVHIVYDHVHALIMDVPCQQKRYLGMYRQGFEL